MPHRYFTTDIANGQARLHGDDAHHLAKVMRGRVGDTVILCDGHATEYTGTITALQPDCVEFSVEPGYPSVAEPGWRSRCLWAIPSRISWSRSFAMA